MWRSPLEALLAVFRTRAYGLEDEKQQADRARSVNEGNVQLEFNAINEKSNQATAEQLTVIKE